MKWIKKNKFTVLAIVLFALLAFLAAEAKDLLFPDSGKAIYGDRLAGKVEVDKVVYDTVKTKLNGNDKVTNVTVRENGKRIDIMITVTNATSKEEAKKITDNILEPFSESQIGYYDFQVIIKKDDAKENDFPLIGYKHHNSSTFVFTKDRDKTEEDS